jgi:hypothetical protein
MRVDFCSPIPPCLLTGPLIFHWADNAPADDAPHVAGSHDTLLCHSARGEYPLCYGQMTVATADSTIAFGGSGPRS